MSEQQQSGQAVFAIEKLYVKDLSLEVPGAPEVYRENAAPQVEVSMNSSGKQFADNYYEVLINTTVTAKNNEKTVFLVELTYGGIFQIRNVPESEIEMVLGVTCPNIVFPYLREVISETVSRAGFPPVILHPMNFEAIYQARKQGQVQSGADSATH